MDNLTFHPVTASNSGNIIDAAYDEESETVLVRFKGGKVYEYGVGDEPVPVSLWEDWKKTFDDKDNSTGSLFHQTIRKYAFRQIV